MITIPSSDPLSVPSLMLDRGINSGLVYQSQKKDDITDAVITGYEVIRFGVPMIGEYVNTGRGRRVTISPALTCAQYRITAWALVGGNLTRRSRRPAAVEFVVPGQACEYGIYMCI